MLAYINLLLSKPCALLWGAVRQHCQIFQRCEILTLNLVKKSKIWNFYSTYDGLYLWNYNT